jgi:hypothetical protein
MSPDEQFWWNWLVSVAVAVGTIGTVIAALFGNILRTKFFPPRLEVHLRDAAGEFTPVRNLTTLAHVDDARYYHLRVLNRRRRLAPADVQTFLIRIEEPGPDGSLRVSWSGELPFRCRDQEHYPVIRTIGPPVDYDLCAVFNQDRRLTLLPLYQPFSLPIERRQACRFVATFQARSGVADSDMVRLQIAWDGRWADGSTEMRGHLVVGELH